MTIIIRVYEYKWLVESGQRDIASTVDTSSVVAGDENPAPPNVASPSSQPDTIKPTP